MVLTPSGKVESVQVGGRNVPLPRVQIEKIVRTVLSGERRKAEVSVTFLGLVRMRQLNRRHKGHDRGTDVLSFPLLAPDGTLLGDIYICTRVARQQARRLQVSEREELTRLVVHGVLHVLGYDHPETEAREQSAMWRRQERYVKMLSGKSR